MYSFVPIYPSGIWSWTFASKEELYLSHPNCRETKEMVTYLSKLVKDYPIKIGRASCRERV